MSVTVDTTLVKGFKLRHESLVYRKNTYVVFNDDPAIQQWDYFSITPGEPKGLFLKLNKAPPLIKEGYVCYEGRIFKVRVRDILRSQVYINGSGAEIYGTTTATASSEQSSATEGSISGSSDANSVEQSVSRSSDEQAALDPSLLEDSENADMAWAEQVGTLQHLLDT